MNKEDRIRIIKDSLNTLKARKIIKTQEEFADLINYNPKSLSAAKHGDDRYCTDSLIEAIMALMKEYEKTDASVSGAMVNNSPGAVVTNGDHNNVEVCKPSTVSAMAAPYQNMRCVPTIPIHAYRAVNFDVMEYFNETHDDLRMSPIIMQFPGTDCYYFVNSEDMSPNLRTNDLLCLSRLPKEAKVTNGDICIINTKYQGIIERFVYDEGDHLLVKSTQPRWTDMRIPKEEIFNIFRILGGIRTNI